MSVLEFGILSPYQESCILNDIEWRLDAEIQWQNQKLFLESGVDMRDVKNAATNLKGMMATLLKATNDAQAAFGEQVARGVENAGKMKAAAVDLREANQMMEEVLGETGSNFQHSDSSEKSSEKPHTMVNGVTLNPEQK